MKAFKKISVCALLAVSLALPSFSLQTETKEAAAAGTGYTQASDVVYKKTSNRIHNWGARDEECVFLSTYAENFYSGDSEYEVMSKVEGGTSQSNAKNSDLFDCLQEVMATPHTFFTYYDGNKNVREFYKYTDCVKSDTSKVSLLYKGTMVSSTWDSGKTWNQEHMWPKSKLSTSKEIGDIMQLRPANPSENSYRSNKAYGIKNTTDYYDPDKCGQSVRGDCARMALYMYVRWGSSSMWGSGGVIESLSLLLDWMEEDPVDTWEMGRNDAVQSVTGTRNVFVDYPEYAWLLFGQEIPDDMVTPSGMAKGESLPEESSSEEDSSIEEDSSVEEDNSVEEESSEEDSGSVGQCSHEFGDWIVMIEPTELTEGERRRKCKHCDYIEQETFPFDPNAEFEMVISCSSSIASSMGGMALLLAALAVCKRKR